MKIQKSQTNNKNGRTFSTYEVVHAPLVENPYLTKRWQRAPRGINLAIAPDTIYSGATHPNWRRSAGIMNHYRIRLIIGSACTSAALTVLLLNALGWLQPRAAPADTRLVATTTRGRSELSPLRIDCSTPVATLQTTAGEGKAPLYLLDDHRRLLACVPVTAAAQ